MYGRHRCGISKTEGCTFGTRLVRTSSRQLHAEFRKVYVHARCTSLRGRFEMRSKRSLWTAASRISRLIAMHRSRDRVRRSRAMRAREGGGRRYVNDRKWFLKTVVAATRRRKQSCLIFLRKIVWQIPYAQRAITRLRGARYFTTHPLAFRLRISCCGAYRFSLFE